MVGGRTPTSPVAVVNGVAYISIVLCWRGVVLSGDNIVLVADCVFAPDLASASAASIQTRPSVDSLVSCLHGVRPADSPELGPVSVVESVDVSGPGGYHSGHNSEPSTGRDRLPV